MFGRFELECAVYIENWPSRQAVRPPFIPPCSSLSILMSGGGGGGCEKDPLGSLGSAHCCGPLAATANSLCKPHLIKKLITFERQRCHEKKLDILIEFVKTNLPIFLKLYCELADFAKSRVCKNLF